LVDRRVADCVVIGGGPAGLTAALYLARYRRNVIVVDAGRSRALNIRRSHNYPGLWKGISGYELLDILRRQATEHGAEVVDGTVTALRRTESFFVADTTHGQVVAPNVVIATGITDARPNITGTDEVCAADTVRFCPVCDGFEAIDRRIAVYGSSDHAMAEARFLRSFSRSVTVLPDRQWNGLSSEEFEIASIAPVAFKPSPTGITVCFDNEERDFDVLYPALGCEVHSKLPVTLGARCTDVGCLIVDNKQKTSVEGLYAAGDVVSDLHQIVVAEGHAAIAATAIHNSLPRNYR
jgi:thioredoxin reductase (NADPH)